MFQISQLEGKCMVRMPNESEFKEVIEHKAYLFGSELRLLPDSSAVLSFSPDTTLTITSEAVLKVDSRIDEANGNKMTVSISLTSGHSETRLEKDFQNLNGFEIKVAGVIVVGTEAATFEVSASESTDTLDGQIKCNNGTIMVMNRHFTIPKLMKDNRLNMTCSRDMSYLFLSNLRGIYNINLKDSEGNIVSARMETDSAAKFWEKKSPYSNVLSASSLIIGPDGCSTNAVASYTEPFIKDITPLLAGEVATPSGSSADEGFDTGGSWGDDTGFDLGNGFDF